MTVCLLTSFCAKLGHAPYLYLYLFFKLCMNTIQGFALDGQIALVVGVRVEVVVGPNVELFCSYVKMIVHTLLGIHLAMGVALRIVQNGLT